MCICCSAEEQAQSAAEIGDTLRKTEDNPSRSIGVGENPETEVSSWSGVVHCDLAGLGVLFVSSPYALTVAELGHCALHLGRANVMHMP